MMSKIIRQLLIVLVSAAAVGATADKQKKETTGLEGWGLGAGVFDEDFGVQGRKDFTLGEAEVSQLSFQGSVFFHDKTTFRFDADYHHILNPGSSFKLYPLVGAEFSIRRKANRWGANIGGGLNVKLTEHNDLFIELKYVYGDWDGFGLMAGIHF